MTERSVPIVGGASVCPFIAFEDDRDERGSRPDHRHRCFAEVRPATRALAHQEAYCLAPAFPACPSFQDWARREAARARASAASVRSPEIDEPVARRPHRDWSAPPPWLDETPGQSRTTASGAAYAAGAAGAAGAASRPEGAGLAESPLLTPDGDRAPTAMPPTSGVRPTSGAGRGAAGTGPAGSGKAVSTGAASAGLGAEPWDRDDDLDELDELDAQPASAASAARGAKPPSGRRPSVSDSRRTMRSLNGPSWERPQRHEAYPTIRTRVRLPSVSRVAVAFAGLIAAALLLFFIPPLLIRPGGAADTGAQATPTASSEASPSIAPTPVPAPTPQVYVIVEGDTLSAVAKSHGLSLEELLAANPAIKNPDKVGIGDVIILPTAPPGEVVDSGGAGASAAPTTAP